MQDKPQHVAMDQFPFIDGELHIGGIPLSRLAEQVGQTPFYAYDRNLISQRVQYLRDSLPPDVHLHYALKANPMPALVQHLRGLVDGFDIGSGGELKIALDTTMPRQSISFASPGKSEQELRQAIAAGIIINLESETELSRISAIAEVLGIRPKIALRINPDFELKYSGMKMGGGPKQFGIDEETAPAIISQAASLGLDVRGLHIYWGSQNLNTDAIMEAHNRTFEIALRLGESCPTPIRYLNIGGGLGIPYFPGENRLDLKPVGENLDRLIPNLRSHLPEAELITELGRYIVGEAGLYVCRILDIKQSRGKQFLITDGGLHQHLAASGNFGQVVRKNYPISVGLRRPSRKTVSVNIVGHLCTPLDVFAHDLEIEEPQLNDLIVIYQSGAYGLTASPHQFLGQTTAPEALV